jgi:hypothetical protein
MDTCDVCLRPDFCKAGGTCELYGYYLVKFDLNCCANCYEPAVCSNARRCSLYGYGDDEKVPQEDEI